LAVLVVATPCPLILAAPAAMVGGVSAAAKRGIIVKGGLALESLADGEVVLLDKTGTITSGRPRVAAVHPMPDTDAAELLHLAGSLDQVSVHPFAPAIVQAAHARNDDLVLPTDVVEDIGQGIRGRVGDVQVRVGQMGYAADGAELPHALRRVRRRGAIEGRSVVYVAADGELVGALSLHDPIRPDAPRSIQAVRDAGIREVLMVTGDRTEIADLVGDSVGVDRVLAERSPQEKVDAVREASALGTTIMVGDGVNDAPALALANTGVAMGARGATAASEAADVVLTSDRLDGLATAVTNRPTDPSDRLAERGDRDRPVRRRDGVRRARLPHAGRRGDRAGGHRPGGVGERPTGAARPGEPHPPAPSGPDASRPCPRRS
jgi:cation transport ATPase